jgi:uncharacterized protein YbjT (DUF2867 family)
MILVTGATGRVGRELVTLLLGGGEDVVAVSRDPAGAALPAAVRVVEGHASRPETVAGALDGAEAIFVVPRAVGDATAELLSLAAARGVRRAVLVSALTVQYGVGERRFRDAFGAAEDAVRAWGLGWTILRAADFDANTLVWAGQIAGTGIVRGAYGDSATSPIHERDIAAVAARALVDPAHDGMTYVLTGPQSLTQRDRVRLIGEVAGREVSWQEMAPEQVRQAMLAQGLPEEAPARLLGYLSAYVERPGPSSHAVEQVLGRPALTFAEWVADNAAAFRP